MHRVLPNPAFLSQPKAKVNERSTRIACHGKGRETGEEPTEDAEPPVPVRLTVWVAGVALSVMVMAPFLLPLAVGLKVTRIVQLAPVATLEPQLLLWEKSPLALMLVMLRVAFPVFSSVTL